MAKVETAAREKARKDHEEEKRQLQDKMEEEMRQLQAQLRIFQKAKVPLAIPSSAKKISTILCWFLRLILT